MFKFQTYGKNILLKIKNEKRSTITKKDIKLEQDYIILSPGININKCSLSKFLKKNIKKINTDLDIFYSIYKKNKNIDHRNKWKINNCKNFI